MKAFAGSIFILTLLLSLMVPAANTQSESETPEAGQPGPAQAEPLACQSNLESAIDTILINPEDSLKRPTLSNYPDSTRLQRRSLDELSSTKYRTGIPCVPLMLVDDPNTLIVCDKDAGIRAEKRIITLSRGKGIYMIGKQPVTVETPLGTINLPGNSAAIIEQRENGLLRVAHLSGSASTVSVKRWKGTKTFDASSGEEIVLAPRHVKAVPPSDGVARIAVSSKVGENGIQFSESKFAPKTMLDRVCLLQCGANNLLQVRRKVFLLRKTINEQAGTEPAQLSSDDSSPILILAGDGGQDAEQVVPVTFSEPVSVQPQLNARCTDSALIKYTARSEVGLDHPSVTELQSGEMLVSANKRTFVKTPDSMLRIEPGTIVLVSVKDGVSKVRNLWENSRNGLCLNVENTSFRIAAGDESLTGSNLRSIYLSASHDMIGRRLTHYTELPSGTVVHFAEVSLMSLAQSNDLLAQLMASNEPDDKSINKKINKMAAILVQISASHGLYELMQPLQWRHDAKTSALTEPN